MYVYIYIYIYIYNLCINLHLAFFWLLHLVLLSSTLRTPASPGKEKRLIYRRDLNCDFCISYSRKRANTSEAEMERIGEWRESAREQRENTWGDHSWQRAGSSCAFFPIFSFSFFPVILKCFPPPPAKCNNSVQIAYVITFWQTSQSNLTFIFTHLLPLYFTVPALFLSLFL